MITQRYFYYYRVLLGTYHRYVCRYVDTRMRDAAKSTETLVHLFDVVTS